MATLAPWPTTLAACLGSHDELFFYNMKWRIIKHTDIGWYWPFRFFVLWLLQIILVDIKLTYTSNDVQTPIKHTWLAFPTNFSRAFQLGLWLRLSNHRRFVCDAAASGSGAATLRDSLLLSRLASPVFSNVACLEIYRYSMAVSNHANQFETD